MIQPILICALIVLTLLYLTRLRSRILDGMIVLALFGCALVLVIQPSLATRAAMLVGVGRGVDLIFYITIPGLAFLVLLLFSKMRTLSATLTELAREQALANAHARQEQTRNDR